MARPAQYRKQRRLLINYERSCTDKLAKAFVTSGNHAARLIAQEQPIDFAMTKMDERIRHRLTVHYRVVIRAFANLTADMVSKVERDEFERLAMQFMATYGGLMIARISENMRQRIMRVIRKGYAEGLSVEQVAYSIRDYVKSIALARARVIARTETHAAASYSSFETAKRLAAQTNMKMMKTWVSANDDRTRANHRVMNGVKVEMDEDFQVPTDVGGGVVANIPMARPHDERGGAANNINCRCVLIYRLEYPS